MEKIIASKNANAGFFNKRQLVFGLFDQRIHGIPDPAWEDGKPPLAEEMAKLVRPKLLLSTCTGRSSRNYDYAQRLLSLPAETTSS